MSEIVKNIDHSMIVQGSLIDQGLCLKAEFFFLAQLSFLLMQRMEAEKRVYSSKSGPVITLPKRPIDVGTTSIRFGFANEIVVSSPNYSGLEDTLLVSVGTHLYFGRKFGEWDLSYDLIQRRKTTEVDKTNPASLENNSARIEAAANHLGMRSDSGKDWAALFSVLISQLV